MPNDSFGLRTSDFGLRISVSFGFLLFCFAPLVAGAEAPSGPSPSLPAPGADVVGSSLRVLAGLALVTALVFAGAWLARNWSRLTARNAAAARLRVLEVRPLGQRHALYVVGYDRERLLLAASPAGVSLLCQLPPADGSETAVAAPASINFTEVLAKALGR